MKIVRAKFNGEIFYGELIDDEVLGYEGSPFVQEPSEEKYNLNEITLLSPVLPSKVTGVAKNYLKHAVELGVHDYSALEILYFLTSHLLCHLILVSP